ncbi:MAG: GTPase Era [Coriobacteriales bacterium]|jgi:GTP-binding protein Era|nr:GTPase Era [Coriobacteriales bacterium]
MEKITDTSPLNTLSAAPGFRSGFVTFIGRPNAGKSTLLNALTGTKLAITSDTPQTTRHRFRAILDGEDYQLILVDTPGIHKPHDSLGEELNYSALQALQSVDAVAFLLDATREFGKGDLWILEQLKGLRCPLILVVSKTDKATPEQVEAQIEAATAIRNFDVICALSAVSGEGLERFKNKLLTLLPEGPRWFPAGMRTDQDLSVLIAEFIREKVLYLTRDEVPHAVGVEVEEISYDKKKDIHLINAMIFVERDSQKGILIGKGGEKIKEIGTSARNDLAQLLASRVYLDLRVKVRKNWRRDINQIRRFGYGQGN